MGAALGDAASDQHGDAIGVARRRDTVRDEDRRASLHRNPQAGEDALFGVGVYTR